MGVGHRVRVGQWHSCRLGWRIRRGLLTMPVSATSLDEWHQGIATNPVNFVKMPVKSVSVIARVRRLGSMTRILKILLTARHGLFYATVGHFQGMIVVKWKQICCGRL